MKARSRIACISAAVAALLYGGRSARATSLTWDSDPVTAGVQDGSGTWDTTTANWFDGTNNVTWNNATPDSATFGNPTTVAAAGTPNAIEFPTAITVQDLSIGLGTNGQTYNFSDFDGGSLTVAGNLIKTSAYGNPQFLMPSNGITLTSGDHVFAVTDTSGDAAPELTINGAIHGPGNLVINTAFANAGNTAYGSVAFNVDNDYTGTTTISKGRLEITTSNGLGSGSAAVTISNQGALSIGGSGLTVSSGLNITNPIIITRNTYTGGDFGDYTAALIVNNNGPSLTHTLSGGLTVDSSDARISVNTNTLVIPTNIQVGPDVSNGTLSFTGDYAGYVQLNGDNSALVGGITLLSAVEVQVNSQANLGGPSSPITFSGDATLGIMNGFMTDFGTHPINTSSFSGGLDIPTGQTFNETLVFTGGNGLGMRGGGTLNLNAAMNTTATSGGVFWDAGTVNVNASVTLGSLHLRSPVVNINNGGSITTTSGYSSFGQDSPDSATINLFGNATLTLANQDFNISDNANTHGVLNAQDTATITAAGNSFFGKNLGSTGAVNLSGNASYTGSGSINIGGGTNGNGTFTLNGNSKLTANGQFFIGGGTSGTGILTINANSTVLAKKTGQQSFAIGGGTNGIGTVNMNGGTLTVTGETWVGNNVGSVGTFTQTGGTTTINDWLAIGRSGATGTFDISGGTFTRGGTATGDNNYISDTPNQLSVMNVHGTGSVTINTGQFWLGNAGSSKGTLNIYENGIFQVTNNWLAVGRNGTAQGVINLSGNGTLIKTGTGTAFTIGSGATGVVNQTGGTISSDQTYDGETGTGTMNLSGGTANLGIFSVGLSGSGNGTLNISGTAAVSAQGVTVGGANTAIGTINLNGGSFTVNSINGGTSTAARTVNFNSGTLFAGNDSATFMQGLSAANVKNGGAIINSNGHTITIAQSLASGGTGGLNKNGLGTLTLSGTNAYSGGTTVNGGVLAVSPLAVPVNNSVVVNAGEYRIAGAGNYALSSLTISSGTAHLLAGRDKVLTLPAAPVIGATGQLDLEDSAMIVNYGSETTGATLANVRNLLVNGRNAGPAAPAPWNGAGGIISTFAHNNGNGFNLAIGYADNAVLASINAAGSYTSFGGQTVGSHTILIQMTYGADANLDGKVDGSDVSIIGTHFNQPGSGQWYFGDFDYSGMCDGNDISVLGTTFGQTSPALSPAQLTAEFGNAFTAAFEAGQSGGAAVPEPTSITLLGLAAIGLARRRRRRN